MHYELISKTASTLKDLKKIVKLSSADSEDYNIGCSDKSDCIFYIFWKSKEFPGKSSHQELMEAYKKHHELQQSNIDNFVHIAEGDKEECGYRYRHA